MSEPNGWKRKPLGCIAHLIMGQSPESRYYSEEEIGLPFLQGCAEFGARFPKHVVYCSQPKKVGPRDSILFSVRAPVGRLNVADRDYIIGRGLAAIIGDAVDQQYLEHFLRFEEREFQNASQGSTFEAINSSELSSWPVAFPGSTSEQSKIAEILSTVERAIEQTEALIAKQQRIKTGLMQDVLTRGIDEQGNLRSKETHPFKDSPLGRIPVEWEPSSLGKLATFYSGYAFKNQELTEHGWRVVRISNLHKPDFPFWYYEGPITQSWIVRSGDILFSWAGVASSIDCVRYFGPDALMNQHIYNLKFASDQMRSYVYYFLQSYVPVLRTEIEGGAGQLHLTKAKIQSIPIPELDDDELNRTVELLDTVESTIDGQERQLRKLCSLKTALMQDLLTGEKRVTPLLEPAVTT